MICGSIQHVLTVYHGHMAEIAISGDGEASAIWAMEDIIRNLPRAPGAGDPRLWPLSRHLPWGTDGWRIARPAFRAC